VPGVAPGVRPPARPGGAGAARPARRGHRGARGAVGEPLGGIVGNGTQCPADEGAAGNRRRCVTGAIDGEAADGVVPTGVDPPGRQVGRRGGIGDRRRGPTGRRRRWSPPRGAGARSAIGAASERDEAMASSSARLWLAPMAATEAAMGSTSVPSSSSRSELIWAVTVARALVWGHLRVVGGLGLEVGLQHDVEPSVVGAPSHADIDATGAGRLGGHGAGRGVGVALGGMGRQVVAVGQGAGDAPVETAGQVLHGDDNRSPARGSRPPASLDRSCPGAGAPP